MDGRVSYEEAFTVQPFSNLVATQTFTGAQLLEVLKDQWCGANSSATVLLPSSGVHYTWTGRSPPRSSASRAPGAANPVSGLTIDGTPLDPAASYRITTNNFLADGGDDFSRCTAGTNRTTRSASTSTRSAVPGAHLARRSPPALDRIDAAVEERTPGGGGLAPPPPGRRRSAVSDPA